MHVLNKKWPKYASLAIAVGLITMANLGLVVAAIANGYKTDDKALYPGMVAALSSVSGDETKVERASIDNKDKIIGVATTVDDSLVTVASDSSQVYIESQGELDAYVTNLNGTVKKGDLLAISPLKGILMREDASAAIIVGIALADFDDSKAETHKLTDSDKDSALIQKIRINLDRKAGSGQAITEESALSKLGRSVVGKKVAEIKVVVALVIFVLVMIAEGSILYGSISSAITSLGRNPLASIVIRKELLRVIFVVLTVLLIGLGAMYVILWI